jgi:hypothetical protein
MTVYASGAVSIETLGPVTSAAVVWRSRAELKVTVIVKVMLAIIPDGEMVIVAPAALVRGERHHHDNPLRSLRATSELAPYLPQADVVLIGHACAPHGEPVSIQPVRLAIYGEQTLLDKTVHVYGERTDGFPQPFDRIPLRYELALGGPGCDENPFGVGAGEGRDPDPFAANIICPEAPTRPVGFGPLSRAWPSCWRLLSKADREALDRPVAELGDAFDWTYFQAAPADQRIPYLHGNEWIFLEGIHPDLPRFTCRLPGARAAARVYGAGPAREISFNADQLHIDTDEFLCALVWRRVLPVRDEAELRALRILTGVALPGQPIAWPDAPSSTRAAPSPPGASQDRRDALERTLVSGDNPESSSPVGAAKGREQA